MDHQTKALLDKQHNELKNYKDRIMHELLAHAAVAYRNMDFKTRDVITECTRIINTIPYVKDSI